MNHKDDNSGFFDTFITTEKTAISQTTINNDNTSDYYDYYSGDRPYSYLSGSNDYIFLLDLNDMRNTNYGFCSDPTGNDKKADPNCTNLWWLRSPGADYRGTAAVSHDGTIQWSTITYSTGGSARPAFNLDLSKVLFSSVPGTGYDIFRPVAVTDADTWKLTLNGTDTSLAPSTSGITSLPIGYSGYNLPVTHTAANAVGLSGVSQVSAMLTDSNGVVLNYGRINEDLDATGSNVTIPAGLKSGNYNLYVFAEDINEGNLTNYATPLGTAITITVRPPVFNTPDPIAQNSITASVTFDKESPQMIGTTVTAIVNLSGTAATDGIHTIGLSSNTVSVHAPLNRTVHVSKGENVSKTVSFTFEVGEENIEDLILNNSFLADTHLFTADPMVQNFGTVSVDYAPIEAQTITLRNVGNGVVRNLQAELTGENAGDFILDTTDMASGLVTSLDGTAVVTNLNGEACTETTLKVRPKDGLLSDGIHAKNYLAQVKLTAEDMTDVDVSLGFTVVYNPDIPDSENPENPMTDPDTNVHAYPLSANEITFTSKKASYPYTGKPITPAVTVKSGKTKLKQNVDYLLTYHKNINCDTGSYVTITGIGEYGGSIQKSFTISPRSFKNVSIEPLGSLVNTGDNAAMQSELEQRAIVRDGAKQLTLGRDYQLLYNGKETLAEGMADSASNIAKNNSSDKDVRVTMKGISGNYVTEVAKKSTSIKVIDITGKTDLSAAVVALKSSKSITYNGKVQKPKVTITFTTSENKVVKLKQDKDYKLVYTNNVNAATVSSANAPTARIYGIGKYYGSASCKFAIEPKSMKRISIGAIPDQYYTGNPIIRMNLVVKAGSTRLQEGTDYTVSYNNAIEVSTKTSKASAVVTLKDNKNFTFADKAKKTGKTFKIVKARLNKKTATIALVSGNGLIVSGNEIIEGTPTKQNVVVTYQGEALTQSTDGKAGDYKVVKIQPVKKGRGVVGYQVQVKGMNHYSGNGKKGFFVRK